MNKICVLLSLLFLTFSSAFAQYRAGSIILREPKWRHFYRKVLSLGRHKRRAGAHRPYHRRTDLLQQSQCRLPDNYITCMPSINRDINGSAHVLAVFLNSMEPLSVRPITGTILPYLKTISLPLLSMTATESGSGRTIKEWQYSTAKSGHFFWNHRYQSAGMVFAPSQSTPAVRCGLVGSASVPPNSTGWNGWFTI